VTDPPSPTPAKRAPPHPGNAGLAFGLVLIFASYGLHPFAQRRKKKDSPTGAGAAEPPGSAAAG